MKMRIKFLDRKSTAEKIIYTIVFILFTAFALSYLYIFFWGIVASLKTHTENVMKPFAFPEVAQWKNFKEGNWQKSINVSDFIQKNYKQ